MKNLLIALMISCCAAVLPATAAEVMSPDALAKSVTEEVLAVLRADKDIQAGNTKKVIELVENKVLPHFNFTRMTRLAVGANWRQATPEQQKVLTSEFRTLLVQTYAATLTAYRDQKVEFRPLRLQPTDTDVLVKTSIIQPAGKPVGVDYRMEKSDGGWKVYDVVVADLSLVQNYRGTFNAEVQKGGIDGLIKALADKNKQLTAK
ncbi:MAG TPA: ABC transporter substrate-binding protein [Burkholderiales bacterium]|nr:ABC transporter substrate-binding protein [Burkholderiales bacterium]